MLREDYETKFTTLNQPFVTDCPNKHSLTRLYEINLKTLKTEQIFPHRLVIRFNSTYVETMDSWESIRGRAIGLAIPMWAVCLAGSIFCLYASGLVLLKENFLLTLFFFALSIGFSYMIYIYYRISKYDLFGYTHYPIRFNRKTQKVYAFSPQQNKIIKLNWADLRFSVVSKKSEIELRASKLNQDNLVEDEIILPYQILKSKPELVEQHLAFFKAYMESDDLERVDQSITAFHDIYNRKESMKESFERLYMQYDIQELTSSERPERPKIIFVALGSLLWMSQFVTKRFALIFSKIPQWPADIEQECQIEKNDPYDSTGKQRYLAPLKFTTMQIIFIAGAGIISFTLLFGFLTLLAILSLKTW